VEVLLRESSEGMHDALLSRGFRHSGKNRYTVQVVQQEKLAVIKGLLGEYGDGLVDMSVVPIEDVSLAISASQADEVTS
jgi:hypothetical protein